MGRELLSLEDPLTYLPRKPVQEFAKRRVIYSPEQPSYSLYVVILGRVKVTNTADDGVETIGRIVCSEGLFGESALVGTSARSESAVAIDNVSVMSWTRQEIEQQIEREPHLVSRCRNTWCGNAWSCRSASRAWRCTRLRSG